MEIIWIIFIAVTGACVGSFLNVVIWRMPRGESLSFPPSHCPKCGHAISWYDNIPVLSWLLLRARCRKCKTKISAQYICIELLTSALMLGLWFCYYRLDMRQGMGSLEQSWPTFTAHGVLICALLACSIIDMRFWHVPLGICWFASITGILIAGVFPNVQIIPPVGTTTQLASLGAGIGLIISWVLQRKGILTPSFIDEIPQHNASAHDEDAPAKPRSIAACKTDTLNPRIEVLRELGYLMPAIGLAVLFALAYAKIPPLRAMIDELYASNQGKTGAHISSALTALFGYLLGGALIWGTRIFGTIGFGKEAMGLGDVHILAAAGATCGPLVPVIAFFLAPVFGIIWAIYLATRKKQAELPYGPWLSLGTLGAMLFYDKIMVYINQYTAQFN